MSSFFRRRDWVEDTFFDEPLFGIAPFEQRFTVKLGLENLTDEFYATHVNSLNPFTRERIAEIGRSFYLGVDYGF